MRESQTRAFRTTRGNKYEPQDVCNRDTVACPHRTGVQDVSPARNVSFVLCFLFISGILIQFEHDDQASARELAGAAVQHL